MYLSSSSLANLMEDIVYRRRSNEWRRPLSLKTKEFIGDRNSTDGVRVRDIYTLQPTWESKSNADFIHQGPRQPLVHFLILDPPRP